MNYSSIPRKRLHKVLGRIRNRIRKEKGFMLIETLVAMIILAIGLLGMASMQVVALKNNNSAYTRTQATNLGYDIIERIRNNPGEDYSMSIGSTPSDIGGVAAKNICKFTNATDTLNCDSSQLAVFDQATWVEDIANVLPNGEGGIVVNGSTHIITIRWFDKQGSSTADQQTSLQMSVVI